MGKIRRSRERYPKLYCPIEWWECQAYNERGQGVVYYNDKHFYVDELMVGEKAKVIVYYENKECGNARAILLKNSSPHRKFELGHPKTKLGSYQIAHFNDNYQDKWKFEQVQKLYLEHDVKPIIVGKRSNYRNKVVLHNGGFFPPGQSRKKIIIPTTENFDLMDLDFKKYENQQGDFIIRKLDTEISGKPGENIETTHTINNLKYIVNLNSFYQVNSEMMLIAYNKIKEQINDDNVVADFFAGAATISIWIASKAKKIIAVEVSKSSYRDALKNIQANNIENVQVVNNDVNEFIKTMQEKIDIVILDPARSGVGRTTMEIINNLGIKKIIYLACDIYTQKRDVEFLTNFVISSIQPIDFFPQTYHIENLIVLEKKP